MCFYVGGYHLGNEYVQKVQRILRFGQNWKTVSISILKFVEYYVFKILDVLINNKKSPLIIHNMHI